MFKIEQILTLTCHSKMEYEEVHPGFSPPNAAQWQNYNHIAGDYHKEENKLEN